jgi:hypothetical protein
MLRVLRSSTYLYGRLYFDLLLRHTTLRYNVRLLVRAGSHVDDVKIEVDLTVRTVR